MAGTTMAKAFDEIGAAIQLLILGRVGFKNAAIEKKKLPAGNKRADAKRKCQLVRRRLGVDRLPRHHESINCRDVFVCDFSEVIIGEGRIKMMAFTIEALAH